MKTPEWLKWCLALLLILALACTLPITPLSTPTSVPMPALSPSPTLFPVCTPPLCQQGEVYFCPDECPGGCGTTCATPTPIPGPEPWEVPALSVAYSKGRALWWAVGYNAPRQLTSGHQDSEPQFSPDGRWVLFRRTVPPGPSGFERFELWVVLADEGVTARRLLAVEDLPGVMGTTVDNLEPVLLDRLPWRTVWFPDGRRVAFSTIIQGGYGLDTRLDLWTVDVETGVLTRLLPEGEGGSFAFSPDGTALLVASPRAVAFLDADGHNRRELVRFPFVNTASEYAYMPQPVWVPDGSYGLLAVTSPEPWGSNAFCSLWRLPRSGNAVQIGTLGQACLHNTMEDHLWSPDRAWTAYTTDYGGDLILANADGSAANVYAEGVGEFLGWSPDSLHFVFAQGYAERVMLGGPGTELAPFVNPQEIGQLIELQWADAMTYGFLAVDETYTQTLWVGELGGEPRVIDVEVEDFSVYR